MGWMGKLHGCCMNDCSIVGFVGLGESSCDGLSFLAFPTGGLAGGVFESDDLFHHFAVTRSCNAPLASSILGSLIFLKRLITPLK